MQKAKLQIIIQNYLLVIGMLFLPSSVLASNVYLETARTDFFVGDTVLFTIRIDSENKNINSVEGGILLDHATDVVSLTDINTSGSKFSLWPTRPVPSERNKYISFVGGSPGGFVSNDAIIFNIVLKLQNVGKVILTPADFSVYLHDGKGTKDTVSVEDFTIHVLPQKQNSQPTDDWSNIISGDTTPPEPFEVNIGQNESVFDGKKFLSFNTTDGQSGISHYEVVEGSLPPVRSNDTYVLKEQNKPVQVIITAYDSAGNARESIYTEIAPTNTIIYVIYIIIIVVIIVFIFIFRKIRRARR